MFYQNTMTENRVDKEDKEVLQLTDPFCTIPVLVFSEI